MASYAEDGLLELTDAPLAQCEESEFQIDDEDRTTDRLDSDGTAPESPFSPFSVSVDAGVDMSTERKNSREKESQSRSGEFSSLGSEGKRTLPSLELSQTDEWQEYHINTDSPNLVQGFGIGQNSGGSCADSIFGSSSSGYSSLAGTCDNLNLHTRVNCSGSIGKVVKSEWTGVRMAEETGFGEGSHGGSLEDLVGSFDDKITACFGDMNRDVSDMAPVQIRSDEELISQSRFWNDLTSSFGTVMPVDWTKTVIRNKLFLPVLNLNTEGTASASVASGGRDYASVKKRDDRADESLSDDELVAQLDMHSIIASDHDDLPLGQNPNVNKLATADEVIKEINAMMQQGDMADDMGAYPGTSSGSLGFGVDVERKKNEEGSDDEAGADGVEHGNRALPTLPSPLFEYKLHELSMAELPELQADLEKLTQQYSEILVQELALRDELQFEKEVKNSFISELIKVQNKRRQLAVENKKKGTLSIKEKERLGLGQGGKYLTTVIPYQSGLGPPSTRHMQVMIKILHAINDDSPTTPTLLTDYILKLLCPKE